MAGPGVAGTFLGTQVPDLDDRPLCRNWCTLGCAIQHGCKESSTVMIACSPQQIFAECPPSPGPGGARGRGRCCLTLAGWVSVVPSAIEWALRTPHQAMLKDLGRKSPIPLQSFHGSLWSRGAADPREVKRPEPWSPGADTRRTRERKAHSTVWHRPSQKECLWIKGLN